MLSLDNIIDCFENGDLKSAKNHIEKCKKAIKLLDDTIISLRNFYKNNNEISIFDMKDIINELICIIKSYMNTKKITLDFVYKNEKFLVKSIPTYVKQILLALLANAKDELMQCGFDENFEAKILINLEKIDDEIRVSISDNGRGFEIENKEIYNSFYTTKPNGTGMGLYIAKSLAEDKLNGRLKLENLRNPTKFSLYLKRLDIKND